MASPLSRSALTLLARRFHHDLWTLNDLSLANTLISPNASFRGTLSAQPTDREGFKRYVAEIHAAFSDWNHRVDDVFVDGRNVIAKVYWSGRHTAAFRGVEATGRAFGYPGVSIFKVDDQGRVEEAWVVGDTKLMWDTIRGEVKNNENTHKSG